MSIESLKKSVEILCIGTEILLGDILNSNARWIAQELAELGLPHYIQTVVGDNTRRIQEAILNSSRRSNILIITGGLGPTPDDLTTESLASLFKADLYKSEEVWEDIQIKLKHKDEKLAKCNEKQALLPIGSKIIRNPRGTAPGVIWTPKSNFTILTFPGVPSEMKAMWLETAKPWLINSGLVNEKFKSKVLLFSGISESRLSEKIEKFLESKNPTVAPYASLGEVKLRITANSITDEQADKMITAMEEKIIKRIGPYCYGSDADTLASTVIKLLQDKKKSISVAESCTGGGLGAELTSIPGASKTFLGGVIAYSDEIKKKILGVPAEILLRHGAVSEATVEAMAIASTQIFGSEWAIAISGLAGPEGGSALKPVGLVCFGIAGPNGCKTFQKQFGKNKSRGEIQRLSVIHSLDALRRILLNGY